MTGTVGPKGQVVIPKPIRDKLGIRPGDQVVFIQDEHEVHVRPKGQQSLFGKYKGTSILEDLEREHREELVREGR